jgi:D-alanine transaminase
LKRRDLLALCYKSIVDLCSLNGRIVPLAEARIDPRDRGFQFGDALYEVVKVVGGVALHLDLHLDRLRDGLHRVDVPIPDRLAERCGDLLAASGLATGSLFLQVTRGVAPRSRMPPAGLEPTVVLLPAEHGFDPPAGRPLAAVTLADPRWLHCEVKTTSLMATVTGKLAARDAGADEVIFLGPERELREGGSTNVFVRRGDVLETHPADGRILRGVTRRHLLRLAAGEGFPVVERAPRLAEREEWQEAFLCGTLTGVQPLVALDGEPVPDGGSDPWTRRLAHALDRYEQDLVAAATP